MSLCCAVFRCLRKVFGIVWGPPSTMDSVLSLHPAASGSILANLEIYRTLLRQWTVAYE